MLATREISWIHLSLLFFQYEQELSDLREELLETKRNLASTHEQLILQESSTHKLVASFKERLAESEKSLQKLREEKDKEMKELLDRLVSVESELRKEQDEMQEVIQAKQVIIEAQERRIKSADSSNAKLIATLNQIRSSRNNSKLLNYPSSDLWENRFRQNAVFLKQNTLRKYPLDIFKLYTIVGEFCSQCKPVISLGYQGWDP